MGNILRRLLSWVTWRNEPPAEHRWVITLGSFDFGSASKYFRYEWEEVWGWTSSARYAQKFRSPELAEEAAQSCSLYYKQRYSIKQLY